MAQNPLAAVVAENPSNVLKLLKVDANGNLIVANSGAVPDGAVSITASSGNEANTNAVATLAAATGKTTYITGFTCTAAGATAAAVVEVTVVGLIGGTATYIFTAPAGATVAAAPLSVQFPEPVAASAVDTAIVVTLPALGAGNTNAAVVATGYQL